jgi:hypothetical protein
MVMIEEKARASAGRSSVLEIADRTPGQARSLHHVSIQHTRGSGVKTKSHEPASALRAALDRDASSKHN